MTILIEKASIVDRNSPHHGTTTDILVEDGRIKAIGVGLSEGLPANADKTIRYQIGRAHV